MAMQVRQAGVRIQWWDVAFTVVTLCALASVAAIASVLGLFGGMSEHVCLATGGCNYAVVFAGGLLTSYGPIVAGVAGLAWTLARVALARRAFWVPLVALLAAVAIWFGGYGLTMIGSPAG